MSSGIPLNTLVAAGAGNYSVPTVAKPLNLCKPPQEGLKAVPMQFTFSQYVSWLVDMAVGAPNPPLSQIAALYVDATQSTHDVLITFPDTGYEVRVGLGNAALVPAITGTVSPKFYVTILDNINLISLPGVNSTDIVNVTALNQFVPEFVTQTVTRALQYGLGDFFAPSPFFVQDDCFSGVQTINAGDISPASATVINHTDWYMNAADISIICNTSDGTNTVYNVSLLDSGNNSTLWQKNFIASAQQQFIQLADLKNLNQRSNRNGPLKLVTTLGVTAGNAGDLVASLAYNIFGGILVA